MSWQAYVDDHLVGTKKVSHAAIIGLNGAVWASSANFKVRRHRRHGCPTMSNVGRRECSEGLSRWWWRGG
eukprot:766765-Hanusia_phi.AAC.4